jgi:ABC-type nitrate/sulfonate/bicarbonate transport system permease component
VYRLGVAAALRRAVVSLAGAAAPFITVAVLWQAFAMYGPFPPRLFPGVDKIVATFVRLLFNGILPAHALATLARLGVAFALGAVAGVLVGMLMGRSRWAERLLVPIVSAAAIAASSSRTSPSFSPGGPRSATWSSDFKYGVSRRPSARRRRAGS